MVNTPYLEELIDRSGKKRSHLAEKCGCSIQAFRLKVKGKYEFTNSQVDALCSELGITSMNEMQKIFFAKKVDE